MYEILELLCQNDALTKEASALVKNYCEYWNVSGYHGLLETNIYSESDLADNLATYMNLDRIYEVYPRDRLEKEAEFISYRLAIRWEVFPIKSEHPNCLFEVILADPTQRKRIDWMRRKTQNQISFAVGERRNILNAINMFYPTSHQLALIDDVAADQS